MSALAIIIIAIQAVIILLMACPAWLVYMILSDRDVMAQLIETKAKINDLDSRISIIRGMAAEWSYDQSLSPKSFDNQEIVVEKLEPVVFIETRKGRVPRYVKPLGEGRTT